MTRRRDTPQVSTRERPIDRGRRLAAQDRARAGRDIRSARIATGLSLSAVASASGMSPSNAGRIERGVHESVSLDQLARLGAAVGLDVRTRTYPGIQPAMDAAQLALLNRLRARLHPALLFKTEVPLPIPGDYRAFDGAISMFVDHPPGQLVAVEAETRLADVQAQHRRIRLKLRDAGLDDVILVVSDTHRNRDALAAARAMLIADFTVSARKAMAALASGRHPGGSSIILL